MNCPHCNSKLVITERQSIEIDYCPDCRGVWLDRGELDKIIERTAKASEQTRESSRFDDDDDDYRRDQAKPHKRKRGGFLGDLFDF